MGFNLGQIIISTLESVDELPIKKRRGWRKPLHSYYKWHGTDVGLGRRTLERKAAHQPPRKIYSQNAARSDYKEMVDASNPKGPIGGK